MESPCRSDGAFQETKTRVTARLGTSVSEFRTRYNLPSIMAATRQTMKELLLFVEGRSSDATSVHKTGIKSTGQAEGFMYGRMFGLINFREYTVDIMLIFVLTISLLDDDYIITTSCVSYRFSSVYQSVS